MLYRVYVCVAVSIPPLSETVWERAVRSVLPPAAEEEQRPNGSVGGIKLRLIRAW